MEEAFAGTHLCALTDARPAPRLRFYAHSVSVKVFSLSLLKRAWVGLLPDLKAVEENGSEMKKIVKGVVLSAALCLCAGYVSNASRAGVSGQNKQEMKESESLSPEESARAKVLFGEKCSKCHGADGRGKTATGEMLSAPDFTDEEWWKESKSFKRLVTSVAEGRDAMPPFGKKLTRREIETLAAHVRTFRKSR